MRRGLMIVVGVILLGASAPTSSLRPGPSPEAAANAATRRGDVTGDGVTTALDGLAILTNVVGKTLPEGYTAYPNGDVNCDEGVSAIDALITLSAVVGRDMSAFCFGDLLPAIFIPPMSFAVGATHGCTISTPSPTCFGANDRGQWGIGALSDVSAFPTSVTWPIDFESLTAGNYFTCGLTAAGDAYCWGLDEFGGLGIGAMPGDTVTTPARVPAPEPWGYLESLGRNTCGVTVSGDGYCWGRNHAGQVGDGSTTNRNTPALVGGGITWAMISSGSHHACGIDIDGGLWCWGENRFGALGAGTVDVHEVLPIRVAEDLRWKHVSAGPLKTCGVTTTNEGYCWGWGLLGNGLVENSASPVRVAGDLEWRFLRASQGGCGIVLSGDAYCWALHADEGSVGDGVQYEDGVAVTVPTRVAGGHSWKYLSLATTITNCGVDQSDDVLCWGRVERIRPCLAKSLAPTSMLDPASACPVSLTVSPDTVDIYSIGGTIQLDVAVTDINGDQLSGGVMWTSSNLSVATVDSTGLITSASEGAFSITAEKFGATATVVGSVELLEGQIAFSDLPSSADPGLWIMTPDGTGQTKLLAGATYLPAWSPDGSKVAFVWLDGGMDVFVVDRDGSNLTNLTNSDGPRDLFPAWSPDGSRIAFTTDDPAGNQEIYVMDSDGSNLVNLTNSPGSDMAPTWSPDGARLAFSSNRDGNREIYVMNADGSGQLNLTQTPGSENYPAWSPVSSEIAFMTNNIVAGSSNSGGIEVINSDGSSRSQRVQAHGSFSWSPDGRHFVVTVSEGGQGDLFIVRSNGGYLFKISRPAGSNPLFVSWGR